MVRILNIARDENDFRAILLERGLCILSILMFVQVGNEHVGTFSPEGNGDSPADATVAAGDDCLFSTESARPLVGVFPMIGNWLHQRGDARR